MATEFIVSPLTEVLYGTDFQINGKVVPIRKNEEVPEEDDSKKNIICRLFDRVMRENEAKRDGRDVDHETKDELYDTIKSSVIACKVFSSRRIGQCYITNKSYGENCKDLRQHVFPGAECSLGARWFFSSLPYHLSAEYLLPFADVYFNFSEYIVPVRDFPNILALSDGKKFIRVNVPRTSGAVCPGFIKVSEKSMMTYRAKERSSLIHPAYASAGAKIELVVRVHFNFDGSDLVFNETETEPPFTDCMKELQVKTLIEHNPVLTDAFRIGDEQIAGFHTAFEVSAMAAVEWI